MTAKAIVGITIITTVLVLWIASSWYAIALALDVLGVTGTVATVLTVVGVVISAALAITVMRMAGPIAFGKDTKS